MKVRLQMAGKSPVVWLCVMIWVLSVAETVTAFTRFGYLLLFNLGLCLLFIGALTGTVRAITQSSGSALHLRQPRLVLVFLIPALMLGPISLGVMDVYMKHLGSNLQMESLLLYAGLSALAAVSLIWYVIVDLPKRPKAPGKWRMRVLLIVL